MSCERIACETFTYPKPMAKEDLFTVEPLSAAYLQTSCKLETCECKRTQTQPPETDCRHRDRACTYSRWTLYGQKKHAKSGSTTAFGLRKADASIPPSVLPYSLALVEAIRPRAQKRQSQKYQTHPQPSLFVHATRGQFFR